MELTPAGCSGAPPALARFKGPRCTNPAATSAEPLEAYVRQALVEALSSHPGFEGGLDTEGELEAAQEALDAAEAERETFLQSFPALVAALGQVAAERQAVELGRRVEAALVAFQAAAREAEGQTTHTPAAELVAGAELEELGPLFAAALERVEVKRGRGPVADRVTIVPRGLQAAA